MQFTGVETKCSFTKRSFSHSVGIERLEQVVLLSQRFALERTDRPVIVVKDGETVALNGKNKHRVQAT